MGRETLTNHRFPRDPDDRTGDVPENRVARGVLAAAFRVHTALGPGLLESVYEAALALELARGGHRVDRQVPFAVEYQGASLGEGFRIDLLVDGIVVVELKSVERMVEVHRKQLLSYIRLSNRRLGLLLNFGSAHLKDGIVRLVNSLPD
jgi:GxxExxY protein